MDTCNCVHWVVDIVGICNTFLKLCGHTSKKGSQQLRLTSNCFDDLGTEKNLKYYGNECNVMAEILLSRYDIFTSKKSKHILLQTFQQVKLKRFT